MENARKVSLSGCLKAVSAVKKEKGGREWLGKVGRGVKYYVRYTTE